LLERAVPILEGSGAGPATLGRARAAFARSKMVAGAHDARSR